MFQTISVIIPAFNEEKYVGRCLRSLLELERDHLELEIIVVDNGSTDKTAEIAKKYGALVFVKPGIKVSALRNYGANLSKGDLLAFVDADCEVSKGWLKAAIQCMEGEAADAVGSFHMIPQEAGWLGRTAELIQRKKVGLDINYIPSGNFLVKRSSFFAVEGFDESLETSEDVDICYRLKRQGYKLFIDSKIQSIHWGAPKAVKEMFYREMWHGKNMCTVFFRDLRAVRNLFLVLYSGFNLVLLLSVIPGLFLLFRGEWSLFTASLALYLSFNLLVSRLWFKGNSHLLSSFGYTVIYGFARSVSLFKWLLLKLFSLKVSS